MKLLTSLVMVAALVALSTSANVETEHTSEFEPESTDYDTEQSPSTKSSLSSPTESSAETISTPLADSEVAPSANVETEHTSELESDLADYNTEQSPSTKSSLSSPTEPSEETSSTPLADSEVVPTEVSKTGSPSDAEGSMNGDLEDNSMTPLYDFSSTSCSSDSTPDETTSDGSFTDEQKSIWIERYNFFRVAALPWAAGNMMRMGWNDGLAKEAASAAASCTASTAPGLNAYESKSTDASDVIEEAINAWIIEPSLSSIGSVVSPAKEGDAVGAGLYNSYTQAIWASTTSVGCAMASCSGGSMVVCNFSPAGNDGTSAWYIHAAQATQCPTGTTALHGLCVVEGDPANELIAPIPDGKWSFQVYPTFIADLMATILKAAQARDAPGADPLTIVSPAGSASELSPGADTQPTDVLKTETVSGGSMAASPAETDLSSLDEGGVATVTEDTTPESLIRESSTDLAHHDSALDASDLSTSVAAPSASTEDHKISGSSATKDTSSIEDLSSDLSEKHEKPSTTDFSSETESSLQTGLPPSSEENFAGKVKPSSAKGAFFENQETPPSSESVSNVPSADLADQDDSTRQDDATKQEATSPTSSKEPSDIGLKAAILATKETSVVSDSKTGVSATGIAGIIVLGVVAVAAFAVFVSYRKNQKRQRDIMHDGGIEVI